jgi:hypothetical protein
MPDLNQDDIKQRAHQIWESEGRPEGRDFQNYMDAVAQLMAEQGEDHSSAMPGSGGIASNLHPGGMAPVGGASLVGSIGTGGAASGPTGTRRGNGDQ